ncbi:MAG: hypothetical protein ACJ8GK_01305 [Luteimonas sp.]
MPATRSFHCCALLLACSLSVGLVGCRRPQAPAAPARAPVAATRPAQAVLLLTGHLRDDDLAAFARDAVPPEVHVQLEAAWAAGRTRWPLDELPFHDRLPGMLAGLSVPGAEARLQRGFDQQFAHAPLQIKGAAVSLGLFGAQYIATQGDYSEDEREHYAQLIRATSRWAASAPLSDAARARAAIPQLAAAARASQLASPADFRAAGLDASLRRVGAFARVVKRVLAGYGLDLDADLSGMRATLQQQTGDSARVRMQYRFAGQDIDTLVSVQRVDGRWYVTDFLRHARAAVAGSAMPDTAR